MFKKVLLRAAAILAVALAIALGIALASDPNLPKEGKDCYTKDFQREIAQNLGGDACNYKVLTNNGALYYGPLLDFMVPPGYMVGPQGVNPDNPTALSSCPGDRVRAITFIVTKEKCVRTPTATPTHQRNQYRLMHD